MSEQTPTDSGRSKTRYEVCQTSELPPGEKTIVETEKLSIGVFNVEGEYYALANVCPHQLAPLCLGRITGDVIAPEVGEYELVREGEIVQCPWHGWKFEIATGKSIFNPHKLSTPTFDVVVEPVSGDGADADERDEDTTDEDVSAQVREYGTRLAGDEPPIDTYDVEVEEGTVVLYV
ncbi:MAG: Rieske (2Fe-2S) protein [Halobacteriales archaeon]|nr:Rieske (2Fe-2S) protein [Halobacteriales archaeon]